MSNYGYCPHCAAEVIARTRGFDNAKDTCSAGHVYPSCFTLTKRASDWVQVMRDALFVAEERLEMAAHGSPLLHQEAVDLAARCRRALNAAPVEFRG